jgi:uracil-DNA glycosylase
MLLLGGVALEHVGGLKGITRHRGQWKEIRGIRTMASWHPSYVMRKDQEGRMDAREEFKRDVFDVAEEAGRLAGKRGLE